MGKDEANPVFTTRNTGFADPPFRGGSATLNRGAANTTFESAESTLQKGDLVVLAATSAWAGCGRKRVQQVTSNGNGQSIQMIRISRSASLIS
jgi:hypothetical protein